MTTISKTIELTLAGGWQAVDAGHDAVEARKLLTYSMLFAISPVAPPTDQHESVQTWHSGKISIRDLGDSKLWVKPLQEANELELFLSKGAVTVTPVTAPRDNLGNVIQPDSYAHTFTYGPNGLSTDSFSDGEDTWVQTFTYTAGNLTGVSEWVKQ